MHTHRTFLMISRHFVAKGEQWKGAVIASADALYLIKMEAEGLGMGPVTASLSDILVDHVGHLYKALVLPALLPNPPMQSEKNLKSCYYKELPEELTRHHDWPLKRFKTWWAVIVLPRDEVRTLRCSRFAGSLYINVNSIAYRLYNAFFHRFSIIAHLRIMGWQVE